MTSEYHDLDSKPCSRAEMLQIMYQSVVNDEKDNFLFLHESFVRAEEGKHLISKKVLVDLATKAGLTAAEKHKLLEETKTDFSFNRFDGAEVESISEMLDLYNYKSDMFSTKEFLDIVDEALEKSNYNADVLTSVFNSKKLTYEYKFDLVKKIGKKSNYGLLADYHAQEMCENPEHRLYLREAYLEGSKKVEEDFSTVQDDLVNVVTIMKHLVWQVSSSEDLDFIIENCSFKLKYLPPVDRIMRHPLLTKAQAIRLLERTAFESRQDAYVNAREALRSILEEKNIFNIDALSDPRKVSMKPLPGEPDPKWFTMIEDLKTVLAKSAVDTWETEILFRGPLTFIHTHEKYYKILLRRIKFLESAGFNREKTKLVSIPAEEDYEQLLPPGQKHELDFYKRLLVNVKDKILTLQDYQHVIRQLNGVNF